MPTPNTHFGAAAIGHMLMGARSLFFIGIGGVNMSSLAEISLRKGYTVGGSDRTQTDLTRELESRGITVFYNHDASHITGYDAVIYTVAIEPDNPEYTAAKARDIPCISRADYLGYIMTSYRFRIGICGMHGKSTTTAICSTAFRAAGTDPTVLCGAVMPDSGSSYRIGSSPLFIFEACEYMDSFLDFNPTVAVILNIEMDHPDYFSSITQIRRSFANFAAITGPSGTAIINADDSNVKLAMSTYPGRLVTFSSRERKEDDEEPPADFQADSIDLSRGFPSFDILVKGSFAAHVDLVIPGRHNISNALAAFAAAYVCGLDPAQVAAGISGYCGAGRRMEFKGRFLGADVYSDYGHHPTEIRCTIDACRDLGYHRVFCVFQPHTYSRVAKLFSDFASALRQADLAILTDIYAAREPDTYGVSSSQLAEAVGEKGRYLPAYADAVAALAAEVTPGDAVIIMGAGDIYAIFPYLGLNGEAE
ncbi:MAG: UDP-N-acetylmuramate--L-alanine ligase [Clostridia bacterium]|nr:UDP-N-acetylmuramate--L-alanine ligase [Clostridia bacterium]MBP5173314.1 UDP-N-acetylmuramate--L-alanine ligase [Clostridia bacterium]